MNIISLEKISKNYSEKNLFNEISLGINDLDKIGLIGINGTGKTTLLKVIAGLETIDSGRIIKSSKCKIEYLPQNPDFEDGVTVLQHVFNGNSPIMTLIREYEATLNILEKINNSIINDPVTIENKGVYENKLLSLTQKIDAMNAWTIENEAKAILTKLKITDFDAVVNTLSGGQKKRVAIACALIHDCELLVLDEPTNHIDNELVDWLENYLSKRKGALLMVTHDRYFLDRVVNKIIELDNGNLYIYQANYSKYVELKVERDELEKANDRKLENLYRNELDWIKRGARARTTKQKARIDRFEKIKSSMVKDQDSNLEINAGSQRLGKKIIELKNISKKYGTNILIDNFSYMFLKDDRIGIVGSNGIGKSTMLKIIAGIVNPDSGDVIKGETIKMSFFSQENEDMDEGIRVIEYVKNVAEFIQTKDGPISASKMLENFLFPPAMQWNLISKLSGGEKRRLYLLKILMCSPNVLILDEPTNDIDITTLTILERYLDKFPGIVITVSHDRYFLDRCANRIFSFEGNGIIKQYMGNYTDYYDEIKETLANKQNVSNPNHLTRLDKTKGTKKEVSQKPLKFTYKEQREFEQIDDIIRELEKKVETINSEIDINASNYEKLPPLISAKETAELELEKAIERWVYLNELAEKIAENKK